MWDWLREFRFVYYDKKDRIILLGLIYVLPLQLCLFVLSLVFSFAPSIYPDLIFGTFYLMAVFLQAPYIIIYQYYNKEFTFNEFISIIRGLLTSLYIPSLMFGFLIALGSYIHFLLGCTLLFLSFFLPYLVVSETTTIKVIFKRTFHMGFNRFFEAMAIVCFFGFLYFSSEWILVNLLSYIIPLNMLAVVFIRTFSLSIILPFMVYTAASLYEKWRDVQNEQLNELDLQRYI
jgi:hypothetical protein